ncbi:fatty acid desaturase [Bacillus pumilus]|uniref:Fatty acid desaturase n=1 Tax=Bacillus pumilus TaxID=1408 RepID=A0A2A5J163_BACPU|nr:guanitoxin biosynthesis L-arginine gamma (S) hydroxylase [Bacillus pumilus]PCK22949.1 fatty acid desaturase [Bacillus pumilus]
MFVANYEYYRFSKEIRDELKPFYQSNNYRGILGILYDYAMIALAIVLSEFHMAFYILTVLIIGSRQRALATILHDASHVCLAKSKKLNRLLGTYFSGYLIGQEFHIYQDSHVKGHHMHLGNPNKDPDYQYHLEVGLYQLRDHQHFFYQYVLRPLFLLNIFSYAVYIFKHRMLQFTKYPKQYAKMIVMWLVICGVLLYFGLFMHLILYWVIPYFTAFMVIGWFIEIAEHYPLMLDHKKSIQMTRNRFSHWMEAFFLSIHAENYHLAHHLQASIPYWNIAKAHQVMMKDETYEKLNNRMGGVFFSSNQNAPLIKDLMRNQKLPTQKLRENG